MEIVSVHFFSSINGIKGVAEIRGAFDQASVRYLQIYFYTEACNIKVSKFGFQHIALNEDKSEYDCMKSFNNGLFHRKRPLFHLGIGQ